MRLAPLALCSYLIVTAAVQGQMAQSGSSKPSSTFTTTSRNVVLDVLVTDKNGNPVHGLKAHDLTIQENGVPQHVKGFEEHRTDAPLSAKPASAVKLPPDTYTNYVTSTEPGAVNIILFDSLNSDRMSLTSARQQLLSYLSKLPGNARVALFTLDSELHLIHGFTDDNKELIAAAQHLASRPNSIQSKARDVTDELAEARFTKIASNPAMYAALQRFLWTEYEAKAESRTFITMEALNQLARSMTIYPGRKNLIWISGGIPFDPLDTTPQMQKTAALMAATEMTVYPIDVRGLPWLGADGPAYSQDVFGPRGGEYSERSGQGAELSEVHETMLNIAHLTGGRAYFNNNDIPGQIQDVVNTGSNYYTLAYRPEDQDWNGKFRKVTVKTSEADVKVRCRPGYYAVKDPFGSPDIDHTFSLAMQPGVPPSTSLVMQARVLPAETADTATQIDFLVDIHDLQFLMSADRRRQPNLMYVAAVWDEKGNARGSVTGTYKEILQPADIQTLLRTGLRLQQQLALKPGNYQLRLGLVDRLSGKMGTIDVPLKVGPS